MHLNEMDIHSHIRNYQVVLEGTDSFLKELASLSPAFYVVDKRVWELYKSAFAGFPDENVYVLEALEDHKNLDTVCELYQKILALSPKKNMNLVSIGGGIVQDITGFVASTLYRGIKWTFVPTTLLAQVDSCIGAKTSLNFRHYKNLIGSFYPPHKVHIWPGFLNTLSEVDYYSGIGEMAKLHLMAGETQTQDFIAHLPALDKHDGAVLLKFIAACLSIKKAYIEQDEFDTGLRNLLNYGHCFGHALETASSFKIPHGQAVVLGMLLANEYARRVGVLSAAEEQFIRRKVLQPIVKVPAQDIPADKEAVVQAMGKDKKNTGQGLALILLEDKHQLRKITDLRPDQALDVLGELKKLAYD